MNIDVIVSKNFILVPSRVIPMLLTRKFTINNICHLNGQRTAQNSRTGGSIPI